MLQMESTELISLKATNGIIYVYEDRVVISRKSVMGFVTQGIRGDRTFHYEDISSIDYKRPSLLANGYLQVIIAGTPHTNARVGLLASSRESAADANTVILRAFNRETPQIADEIYNLILSKMAEARKRSSSFTTSESVSTTDEIRKYKALLDEGIISQEEFDTKKKKLLGM
jgi:hypothetical protein